MRPNSVIGTIYYTLILTLALILTGCSTSKDLTSSQQAERSINALGNNVETAITQLEEIRTSLNSLISPGQDNLRETYDTYAEQVSRMANLQEAFGTHVDQVRSQVNSYLEQWEQSGDEYNNSRIQRVSERRRQELERSLDRVIERSDNVSETFEDYMSDVQEIESYLSNDLSSKGVQNIEPVAEEVLRNSDNLHNDLENLQEAIREAQNEMSAEGSSDGSDDDN